MIRNTGCHPRVGGGDLDGNHFEIQCKIHVHAQDLSSSSFGVGFVQEDVVSCEWTGLQYTT